MIVEEAGVSRSSFYRQFDGKLSLIAALFDEEVPELHDHWKNILATSYPPHDDVVAWIGSYLSTIASDPIVASVMREALAVEPELQHYALRFYDTILGLMWGEDSISTSSLPPELRAKSLLMLLQFDQFIFVLSTEQWQVNRAAMTHAMAENLRDFLHLRQHVIGYKNE